MERKKLKIGLFGFGCVGQGLYDVLEKTPLLNAEIKTICVKQKNKSRSVDKNYFTFEKSDILDDEEVNVVVELIDDAGAAYEIVTEAIRKGKNVVSANKKMIAEHFAELVELQRQHQVSFLYEAACCASIPIIRNLEEYYDNDLLESVEGIVNGSTNYILDRTSEGLSYATALQKAQEFGYAESDSRLDTEGFDSKYKLLILAAHSFGLVVNPGSIFHHGISRLSDTDLSYAKEKGYRIRLIAHAEKTDDGIRAFVLPKFVSADDRFFAVDDVYNAVKTKCCFSDSQFFSGKGAGAHPTASAVLSDLSALSYGYRYEYKKLTQSEKLVSDDNIHLKVLWSYAPAKAGYQDSLFSRIIESYQSEERAYLIGEISLNNLNRISAQVPGSSFVYFSVLDKQRVKKFDLAQLETEVPSICC
jgi:homoserine dehydrogenase